METSEVVDTSEINDNNSGAPTLDGLLRQDSIWQVSNNILGNSRTPLSSDIPWKWVDTRILDHVIGTPS